MSGDMYHIVVENDDSSGVKGVSTNNNSKIKNNTGKSSRLTTIKDKIIL